MRRYTAGITFLQTVGLGQLGEHGQRAQDHVVADAGAEPDEAGAAEAVQKLVAAQMEHAAELAVPLTAEAKVGRSWYEAK